MKSWRGARGLKLVFALVDMATEVLPSYTPEVLPKYDLTPTTSCSSRPSTPTSPLTLLARARDHPTYHYVSERMQLDLGTRRWGTRLPCYGRNGLIEGSVTISSLKHVDRVVVRLLGKMTTSHIISHIPTLSQTRTVLNKSAELWSSSAPTTSSSSNQPTKLPFSFSLVPDEHGEDLPPSASIQLRRANARVAYAVRVDMYRRGIHMHETVQTEILHLPRTTTHYTRPFVPSPENEKRPCISASDWHTTTSSTPTSSALLLPRELQYPSGHPIPFMLSRPLGVEMEEDTTVVELVRTASVQTPAGVIRESRVISEQGCTQSVDLNTDSRVVKGVIETGKPGHEITWGFDRLANITYEIRVRSRDSRHSWLAQRIELTSHEWSGESASALPALSSRAVERRALHLVNMGV